jgi:hypothetical protein
MSGPIQEGVAITLKQSITKQNLNNKSNTHTYHWVNPLNWTFIYLSNSIPNHDERGSENFQVILMK